MKRMIALLIGGVLLFSGCAFAEQQQVRDLENVTQTEPDKSRLVTNVDGYPNGVAICVEGAGFMTTTREGMPALQYVPAWSTEGGWCTR